MPKRWHMISLCLLLLAIALASFIAGNDLAKKSVSSQPPKPNDCCSPSPLSPVGSGATECKCPQNVLIGFGRSFTANVAAGISYTYNTYRHLRAARRYQILIRQYPTDHGYGVLLTLPLPRRKQTEAIATLAGLHPSEVPTLALILEGPVLSTQEFVSAFTEHPLEYAHFLGKYTLYSWWCWGDGFWPFKLWVSLLIMLYAWWYGNARRAAFWLFGFLFIGWFSGVQVHLNVFIHGAVYVLVLWVVLRSSD